MLRTTKPFAWGKGLCGSTKGNEENKDPVGFVTSRASWDLDALVFASTESER